MNTYPFLKKTFLNILENSRSVGPNTGWQPAHIHIDGSPQVDGAPQVDATPQTPNKPKTSAFMPTYIKTHSWGEYVFDWAWADAYQRNGLDYYPKLLSAIPFSPTTGPRVALSGDGQSPCAVTCRALFQEIQDLAEAEKASGWHLLFPDADTLEAFAHPDLMLRTGVQYHWINRNYTCFADFLASFTSRKRKMVNRERRRIKEQGIQVQVLEGPEIPPSLWAFFFRLYQSTYRKRSGSDGYLTPDFFTQLGESMPEHVAMAVASIDGEHLACALYLHDSETLYGRYWGCTAEYDYLHFELCYYQGIEYAIRRGLQRFDAGAQGEHKVLRGFEPVKTHSLHWIRHPGFAQAIAGFLAQETQEINRHINQASAVLPYKQNT